MMKQLKEQQEQQNRMMQQQQQEVENQKKQLLLQQKQLEEERKKAELAAAQQPKPVVTKHDLKVEIPPDEKPMIIKKTEERKEPLKIKQTSPPPMNVPTQ